MREQLRKRLEGRTEEGFTLIELMVVVLIIAILLAIAIPSFLGARSKAQDRAAQSNARNALTAAIGFADPDEPAARVAEGAWTIGDFVTAFPADYDGYVQLRLVLGTPEAGTLSDQPYDTADLRVDGDAWELVRGGTASCADAESVLLP